MARGYHRFRAAFAAEAPGPAVRAARALVNIGRLDRSRSPSSPPSMVAGGDDLCGAAEICDRGTWISTCFEGGCSAGQVCDARGQCVDAGCESLTGPPGERCVAGACTGACDGVTCPPLGALGRHPSPAVVGAVPITISPQRAAGGYLVWVSQPDDAAGDSDLYVIKLFLRRVSG